MGYSDDWRDRHGPRRSGGRVLIYIMLLLVILLIIARAGDFSRTFTSIFLTPGADPSETSPEPR